MERDEQFDEEVRREREQDERIRLAAQAVIGVAGRQDNAMYQALADFRLAVADVTRERMIQKMQEYAEGER